MLQIYDKKIKTDNYLKSKSTVNLLFTVDSLLLVTIIIGITSLPQNQRDISISDLRTRVANITQI